MHRTAYRKIDILAAEVREALVAGVTPGHAHPVVASIVVSTVITTERVANAVDRKIGGGGSAACQPRS